MSIETYARSFISKVRDTAATVAELKQQRQEQRAAQNQQRTTQTQVPKDLVDVPSPSVRLSRIRQEINGSVINLNNIKRLCYYGIPDIDNTRAVVWKLLLGYLPPDPADWDRAVEERRTQYRTFCEDLIVDPGKISASMGTGSESAVVSGGRIHEKGNGSPSRFGVLRAPGTLEGGHAVPLRGLDVSRGEHPLSTSQGSLWNTFFQDSEVLVQVDRDVRRTHPDMDFFTGETPEAERHREEMKRALFMFAKLNPGLRYIQGMNELFAPLYFLFAHEQESMPARWRAKHAPRVASAAATRPAAATTVASVRTSSDLDSEGSMDDGRRGPNGMLAGNPSSVKTEKDDGTTTTAAIATTTASAGGVGGGREDDEVMTPHGFADPLLFADPNRRTSDKKLFSSENSSGLRMGASGPAVSTSPRSTDVPSPTYAPASSSVSASSFAETSRGSIDNKNHGNNGSSGGESHDNGSSGGRSGKGVSRQVIRLEDSPLFFLGDVPDISNGKDAASFDGANPAAATVKTLTPPPVETSVPSVGLAAPASSPSVATERLSTPAAASALGSFASLPSPLMTEKRATAANTDTHGLCPNPLLPSDLFVLADPGAISSEASLSSARLSQEDALRLLRLPSSPNSDIQRESSTPWVVQTTGGMIADADARPRVVYDPSAPLSQSPVKGETYTSSSSAAMDAGEAPLSPAPSFALERGSSTLMKTLTSAPSTSSPRSPDPCCEITKAGTNSNVEGVLATTGSSTKAVVAAAAHAEADAFWCFVDLISVFRDHFCQQLDDAATGVRATIRRLMIYLRRADPELWKHVEIDNKVDPQFYAFRWITLLLSQEFTLPAVLRIWDAILSDPHSRMDCLLRICVAMLLHARETLMQGDFSHILRTLQRYPPVDVDELIRMAAGMQTFEEFIGEKV